MEEKLKRIFDQDYSESKMVDFRIKTEKLYDYLGYDFKLKPKEIIERDFTLSKVWVNKKYQNSMVSNLETVSFDLSYPKIISKLVETNLEMFNEVYSKILEFYSSNKEYNIKKYINLAFGVLKNPNSEIYSNNINLVPIELKKMIDYILIEFNDYIVYVDTDTIVFRDFNEIKESFEIKLNSVNKYHLTYETKKSDFGFFINKKIFLIEEDGNIKMSGRIKHFHNNGVNYGGYIKIDNRFRCNIFVELFGTNNVKVEKVIELLFLSIENNSNRTHYNQFKIPKTNMVISFVDYFNFIRIKSGGTHVDVKIDEDIMSWFKPKYSLLINKYNK